MEHLQIMEFTATITIKRLYLVVAAATVAVAVAVAAAVAVVAVVVVAATAISKMIKSMMKPDWVNGTGRLAASTQANNCAKDR